MARMSQILWDWQHSVTDLKILCSQRKHRNGKNHLDVKFSFMRALVYSWSIQFYPTNPQNPEKPERFQLTLETSWHCQTSDWCILSPAQHLVSASRNKEKGRQTDLRAGKKKVFLWSRQQAEYDQHTMHVLALQAAKKTAHFQPQVTRCSKHTTCE